MKKLLTVFFIILAEVLMLYASAFVYEHTNIDFDILWVVVCVLFIVIALCPLLVALKKKYPTAFFAILAEALMLCAAYLVDKHTKIDSDTLCLVGGVLFCIIALCPLIAAFRRLINNTALRTAAENNDAAKIEHLIKVGADVNAKDDEGRTALMLAAGNNAADAARVLIEAGADLNTTYKDFVTALMATAVNDAADAARVLIEAGADVNEKSKNGLTVLMFAAAFNAADVASVLIEAEADVNAKADDGTTALISAVQNNAPDVVRVLIENMKTLYDVDFSEFSEDNVNKLFLYYKDRFESLVNNGFIMPNSKLLMFLEQDSGSISQNLGQTVKKNLNVGKLLKEGVGGLVGTGIELAKAAGGRMVKSVMNEVIGDKDFMLLTDKNVVLSKKESTNTYDFEEAMDYFSVKQDEVLAGVVDVYDDLENLVLDNIPQGDWNAFKMILRKLKKESKHPVAIKSNSSGVITDIERKLMKLKGLVEKGLLSQDDFDVQKSKLLSSF